MREKRAWLQAAAPMADNTAVTTLALDASGAKKGASDFQAVPDVTSQIFGE